MYAAITTQNARQEGYHLVATGEDKTELEDAAQRKIVGRFWNQPKPIGVATELQNLRIVTATEAKRKYKINL